MPQIYFSFPDGVFDYVCAECNALCCRGQGFGGSLQREMGSLLTLYPSLNSLVVRRRGDVLHFATFRQGCQFLDDDRFCRIEREHGKSLKPGVCTLFPFNAFGRIGDVLVVSPHFLCPLRIRVPPAVGEVAGTHHLLQAAVTESGLIDERTWQQQVTARHLPDPAATTAVIIREEHFRDSCRAALGRETFRSTLLATSHDPKRLAELLNRVVSILGAEDLAHDGPDHIDNVLLAISPSFRMGLLNLPAEPILLALAIGEHLLRDACRLAVDPPTPQSAFNHLSSMKPLLMLICAAGAPKGLAEGRLKTPPFGDAQLTQAAQRLLAGVSAGQSRLAALEDAVAQLATRADRMALLVEVGKIYV